jgi:hypothetical protein
MLTDAQPDFRGDEEAARPSVSAGQDRLRGAAPDRDLGLISDHQLDRLLSCMGGRLEVVRRPVVPDLTRSERRSWQLHRRLSTLLNRGCFEEWRPRIDRDSIEMREVSPMSGLLPDEQRREILSTPTSRS